jgi:hypothetical protein
MQSKYHPGCDDNRVRGHYDGASKKRHQVSKKELYRMSIHSCKAKGGSERVVGLVDVTVEKGDMEQTMHWEKQHLFKDEEHEDVKEELRERRDDASISLALKSTTRLQHARDHEPAEANRWWASAGLHRSGGDVPGDGKRHGGKEEDSQFQSSPIIAHAWVGHALQTIETRQPGYINKQAFGELLRGPFAPAESCTAA